MDAPGKLRMTRELALLLEAARPHPNAETIRSLVQAGVDWPAAIQLAEVHGLAPLLAWQLGRVCPEAVPGALSERLRNCAHFNLGLAAELLRLLDLIAAAGIWVAPFKGPTLAWPLYETPALRQSSDLDLLVQPADVPRVIELLVGRGYVRDFSAADSRFFGWNQELPLTRADGQVIVDLHWRLLPPHFSGLSAERMAARLVPVTVAGREVATLCPLDLLLYLCAHGAKHGWSSLGWLCDIARLIDRSQFAWDAVLREAQEARISRPLLLGVSLAHGLLGADVPPELCRRAQADRAVAALYPYALARLTESREPGLLASLRFQLGLLDRRRDKLRHCYGHIEPTPADWESLHIAPALFPLYFVARPLRLAWKWCIRRPRRVTHRCL
jgi:hypothetical protein